MLNEPVKLSSLSLNQPKPTIEVHERQTSRPQAPHPTPPAPNKELKRAWQYVLAAQKAQDLNRREENGGERPQAPLPEMKEERNEWWQLVRTAQGVWEMRRREEDEAARRERAA